jgi:beta-lactamase class A
MKNPLFPALLALAPLALSCQSTTNVAVTDTTEQHSSAQPMWRTISIGDSRLASQEPRPSSTISDLARRAAQQAAAEKGGQSVSPNEVWVTVIDCRDSHDPRMGSYQGGEQVYPASVIKLCYMLAAFDQVYTRRIAMTEALRADLEQMIFVSDNKATNRILDRLTHTGFGPELEGEARNSFEYKRATVNRYMTSLGLEGLWPTNKTFDDDIRLYGRDVQWLGSRKGDNYEKSNMMTTDDTARMLYLLWRRAVVDYDACEQMLELMNRTEGKQGTWFKKIVPAGWDLYSKDGLTDLTRHDAGIFVNPQGEAIIIVAFSKTRGESAPVVERAAEIILQELQNTPAVLDPNDP